MLVLDGSCRLIPRAPGEAVTLVEGDAVFLPHGTPHTLTASADRPPTVLLTGDYRMDQARAHPLLADFPAFVPLMRAVYEARSTVAATGWCRALADPTAGLSRAAFSRRSARGNHPSRARPSGEFRCRSCGIRRSATTYGARRSGGGTMRP
ncbi:cupin domain-containing protein [Streptomyces abikoensis]|uniref:cupin domain-containing protein n=1 Tax=Streptomyces abikoensis TaxID=97398 RepID=UPI003712A85F